MLNLSGYKTTFVYENSRPPLPQLRALTPAASAQQRAAASPPAAPCTPAILNTAQLAARYPDLVASIRAAAFAEGQAAERKRAADEHEEEQLAVESEVNRILDTYATAGGRVARGGGHSR